MTDKRLSKRLSIRKRIKFGESDPDSYGYVFNISENGIGIKSHKPLMPESQIIAEFFLEGEILRLQGIVKWVSYSPINSIYKMGIKITSNIKTIKQFYKLVVLTKANKKSKHISYIESQDIKQLRVNLWIDESGTIEKGI